MLRGLERLNNSLAGSEDLEEDMPEGTRTPATKDGEEAPNIVPKLWAVYGKTYSPCEKATKEMPAGHYLIRNNPERGIFFSEKSVNMDELMILPDSASEEIIAGIQKFWTKEEHYRKFKFLWKRGVLLYGPPGSGKTSTVQIIASEIVKKNGLAIYAYNPALTIQGLDILRYIEPKRPIVVVLEDIDSIIDHHGEAELLSLLDGEFQIDNAVFIATTNYPEELDKRITNRPSRFDVVKKIGMPSEEAREVYLSAKNPRLKEDKRELKKWVKDTENFSIAHMKEVIISVECLEIPYESVMERLNSMIQDELDGSEHDDGGRFGFIGGSKASTAKDEPKD